MRFEPRWAGLAAAIALACSSGALGAETARAQSTDPVIAAAGDIACDPTNSSFNAGSGTSNSCRQKYTSDLLVNAGLAAVLDLGDNQYYCGGYQAFLRSYDLSWGRVKSITRPAVGNHEYLTSGGTDCNSTNAGASGHFTYFGAAAGEPGKGYYSYDIGAWHLIALNSNCGAAGGCGPTTPQGQWLRTDLATHPNFCTLAYWHVPVFSSGGRDDATYKTFWDALYAADADVVLTAHDHLYERFAPQTPNGAADAVRGIREWVVGTGGANHTSFTSTIFPNSQIRNDSTYGVLKLTLHPMSYDWQFVPEAGRTFADAGSGACHGSVPDTSPPTAPSDLGATPVGGGRVDLSWTPSDDDIGVAGYHVYRNDVEIGSSTTTSYSDRSVSTNTSYAYVVRAYDHGGNSSPPSNTVSVTTGPPDEVVMLTPVADTFAEGDKPTSNFGTLTSVQVDGSPLKRIYLKFDLSSLVGRQVVSAALRLYCVNSSNNGGELHRVADSTWSETGLNWNNAPAADSGVVDALGSVTASGWYQLDVTSLASGSGPLSMMLLSSSSDGADYSSREGTASLRPQLVLTVTGDTTPDTTPPTDPASLQANGVSQSEIDLAWAASSDNRGVAGYEVYRDGALLGTAPGTAYADTGLEPQTRYTYTVRAYDGAGNFSGFSPAAAATTPPPSSTLTFTPTDDTYVQSGAPTATAGNASTLQTDNSPVKNFLVRFDPSGIGARTVANATLRIYCVDSSSLGGQFRQMTNTSWSEATANWNNAPVGAATPLATLGSVTAGNWYELDVTSLVSGDGPVSLRVTSTSTNGADFASKEGAAGFGPQLVVTLG